MQLTASRACKASSLLSVPAIESPPGSGSVWKERYDTYKPITTHSVSMSCMHACMDKAALEPEALSPMLRTSYVCLLLQDLQKQLCGVCWFQLSMALKHRLYEDYYKCNPTPPPRPSTKHSVTVWAEPVTKGQRYRDTGAEDLGLPSLRSTRR